MKPMALHDRIRTEVERRVLSGQWPPGHRIPFEHELMQEYRCSRMTVNKALQSLANNGLIVRRRRAGSFVARPRVQSAVLTIPDIKTEIDSRGEAYAYELLSRERLRAKKNDPRAAQLEGARIVLLLRCRHFASEQVFALEHRAISLTAVPDAEQIDFAAISPGAWLLGHVPWTEAEHRITAFNADAPTAQLLGIDSGNACLAVERRTWRGGDGITHVRQVFPAHSYDLIARFGPGPAPPRFRQEH